MPHDYDDPCGAWEARCREWEATMPENRRHWRTKATASRTSPAARERAFMLATHAVGVAWQMERDAARLGLYRAAAQMRAWRTGWRVAVERWS